MKFSNISLIIINKKGLGIGNIKRSFYLSQLLKKKFNIYPILIGNNNNDSFNPFKKKLLKLEKIDFNYIIKYLNDNNNKKVIIDYYHFPKKFLVRLKKDDIKTIKISDFNEKNDSKTYDLILNQYISKKENYKNINFIIINPQINKYINLTKDKKITIFFGFESNLKKIQNFIKAMERINQLKSYKKTLILYGKYSKKKIILTEYKCLNIERNPFNYFKIISRSLLAFGEAGTAAIERDIFKIFSLNFITTNNQINTPSILKNSNYAFFNNSSFKNSIKFFEKEIVNFLKKINLNRKNLNNLKSFNNNNIINLIKKV